MKNCHDILDSSSVRNSRNDGADLRIIFVSRRANRQQANRIGLVDRSSDRLGQCAAPYICWIQWKPQGTFWVGWLHDRFDELHRDQLSVPPCAPNDLADSKLPFLVWSRLWSNDPIARLT